VVTAAHVIDEGRYDDNARMPAVIDGRPNARLGPNDFLSVRVPATGRVLPAEIVGPPDFRSDVVVIRIPLAGEHFRAVCLAYELPRNRSDGLVSFGVGQLHSPLAVGQRFDDQISLLPGFTGPVLAGDVDSEFEFAAAAIQQGFSGAPIYDQRTGLIIGAVRRSASALGDGIKDQTTLAVSPAAMRGAVQTVLSPLEYSTLPFIHTKGQPPVPDMSLAGKVRLIRFDDLSIGTNGIADVYANYERQLTLVLGEEFNSGNFLVTFPDEPQRAVQSDPDMSKPVNLRPFAGRICRLGNDQTVGAIAIRRSNKRRPDGLRTLYSRIALLDCEANIIDAVNVAPVLMNGDGPTGDQAAQYGVALHDALLSLAGPRQTRLTNFAIDGLPFDDGEYRGFYTVRGSPGSAWIGGGWPSGAGYLIAGLHDEVEITSVAGYSGPVGTLTDHALDALIDAAGPTGVPAVKASGETITLVGADRCATLMRRQQMIQSGEYTHIDRAAGAFL
jgi:hypothetical protein